MQMPEIIAHRGASRERPENTVAAFIRAVELGADGIELDVHLSADNVLIVHHDPVLHDGRAGYEHLRPPHPASPEIRLLTAGELSAFRVGGQPIPTFEGVLDAVGNKLTVYCELKGPGTAAPVVTLLNERPVPAAVHSFDHREVAEARRLAPSLSRGVLEASYHVVPTDTMASVDARDLWQAAELIDLAMVDAVHARGGRIIAWTVDDPATITRLAGLGVDGLCTNDVALCRRTLGR
jgi:glycerophosphoryl diester phosphodiesterase